jgi:Ser/Thr protein kinase RdoA (MazF antagonist)
MLYPVLPVDKVATLEFDTVQRYRKLGIALARLHIAMASFPEQVESWTMDLPKFVFVESIPQIMSAISDQEQVSFSEIIACLEPEMRPAFDRLPVQLIHGDCHGANVLRYRGEVSGFIDLDHTPYGPRIYDIGYFLAGQVRGTLLHDQPDEHMHFGELLQAYNDIGDYPLSVEERRSIWFMMLAAQLLMANHLFKHGHAEFGHKNLYVFNWIHAHRELLEAQFVGA